jgi:hypothetical protein
MHSTKHLTKLAYKYYEGFLETDEIERLLEGKEYWMEAEEIIERLEKRADYWEKKLAEEIAKETPEAETKTFSFDLPATGDESEFDEPEDPMIEAFYESENNTLDNLLEPEAKKQGILDGYDWFMQDGYINVGGRFYIDQTEANILKEGNVEICLEFSHDWTNTDMYEDWEMSRTWWKFTADQLGIQYPPTLSTKLIAKRCQEFCLKVVEEYLS